MGDIVINNVSTSAQISPSNPASGDQFEVTGYQVSVPLPSSIVDASAALGNTSIMGFAQRDPRYRRRHAHLVPDGTVDI